MWCLPQCYELVKRSFAGIHHAQHVQVLIVVWTRNDKIVNNDVAGTKIKSYVWYCQLHNLAVGVVVPWSHDRVNKEFCARMRKSYTKTVFLPPLNVSVWAPWRIYSSRKYSLDTRVPIATVVDVRINKRLPEVIACRIFLRMTTQMVSGQSWITCLT